MYKKLINCLLLLLFFIVTAILIKNYFQPFLSIVILIILAAPVFNLINKYKIFNKKVAALISIVLVNLIIFIFILYSSNFLLTKVRELLINVYISTGTNHMEKNINVLNYVNLNDIIKEFKMYYKDILSSNILWKGAEFTTDIIFSYFVANISAYFILVDKDDFKNSIQYFINKNKLELINKNFEDVKKMLKVEITLVIATTLQTVFGFLILEIDNAVFLGMLCGILDILPYVGTVLVFLPLVIYKIYLKQYVIAVGLIFLYIMLQFSRQLMETKFMSSKLNIHPLMILLSLYIGGKIFGIIGLILAPIYVLIVKEILFAEISKA